jgi:hypothetical protein
MALAIQLQEGAQVDAFDQAGLESQPLITLAFTWFGR